jgi:deazaflavin-dependent oxidoreductase (nitroreductase family)
MPDNMFYTRVSMAMPQALFTATGKLNARIYRLTRGRFLNKVGTAPVLLLTAVGRRSGEPRTVPVVYLADGQRQIVIGSNAGHARTPAWSHNLQASPDAEVQIRGKRQLVCARVAAGEEREQLWRKMNEMYEGFDAYDANVDRDIAVFVLEPR